MMIWFFIIIICILIGIIIFLYPKYKIDQEVLQKNIELKKENKNLENSLSSMELEAKMLEDKKSSLNTDIKNISNQIDNATEELYQKSYNLMQEKLSQSADISRKQYQKVEEDYKNEYLSILEENTKYYIDQISEKKEELESTKEVLEILREKVRNAIEVNKRNALAESEKDYYKIKISEQDIEDIQLLKEVAKKLNKDPEPINKIIWELYYKKPTMNLLGRITPTNKIYCGIYKITNLKTGQCYIGQSTNLRNRLRDHIKAGLGISSSNNKFYSELKAIGPESFMYEIIEECDRSQLNERERYWIDFYESIDWGYNTLTGVYKKND